jgi:hypothetical protein
MDREHVERHRVRPAVVDERPARVRTVTVNGVDYDVVWDGTGR